MRGNTDRLPTDSRYKSATLGHYSSRFSINTRMHTLYVKQCGVRGYRRYEYHILDRGQYHSQFDNTHYRIAIQNIIIEFLTGFNSDLHAEEAIIRGA